MKLWILSGRQYLEEDPWQPWYNTAFSMVIRAETELAARKVATKHCGDEGKQAWLNPELSTCEVLDCEGETEMIIQDYRAA